MKTKSSQAIRELRKIIGQTQGEFATMIGASKDTVASWETSRNKLSPQFARRIAFATGVDEDDLLRGRRPLTTYIPFVGHPPFTAETFAGHRKTYWGRSDEEAARQHLRHCADALGLLFLAAAKPGEGKTACRLPAVVDSFIQWCEETREDFQLDPQIQDQLEERQRKIELNHTYAQWRRMQKEDPAMCRMMGFKDDPQKSDQENLRLEMEAVPLWRPGHSMRGEQ
jgi:transcriptional regulator with XRE-family HTH domain